jgi:peptide/nickel transport system substrate-binding protein
MPGFARYCLYTRDPRPDGRWRAPDLGRARRLVAASGTRGTRVSVWSTTSPQVAVDEGRYVTALLRRLGYRASLHLLEERRLHAYTENARHHAQVVSGGWTADYPAASNFIGKMSCPYVTAGSASSWDTSGFCDPAVDRRIARAQALQTTDPTRANIRWARLDRALTDRAVWLPTVTPKDTNVVSRRTGNYHHHPFLGPLIDQLWVR